MVKDVQYRTAMAEITGILMKYELAGARSVTATRHSRSHVFHDGKHPRCTI